MGKENKNKLFKSISLGFDKANAGVSKAAKATAGAIQVGAGATADGVTKAAKVVGTKAVEAKDFVSDQARASLDKAYKLKRPVAIKHLEEIRAMNPEFAPEDVLTNLEAELKLLEEKTGDESEDFTAAVALYVLSTVEVYGSKVPDKTKRQMLIDAVIIADSNLAKSAALYGGIVLSFAASFVTSKAKGVGKLLNAKAVKKLSVVKPLIALAAIKNPGKKSTAWMVKTATRKILGTPPKSWPKKAVK